LREKVARGRIRVRLANVPPCPIGIEAGTAMHYVARELLALGHDVRQGPPAYAKPFRQAHKNAFRDAYAIGGGCAAADNALRSSMFWRCSLWWSRLWRLLISYNFASR